MRRAFVAALALVMAVAIWKDPLGFYRGGRNAAAATAAISYSVVNVGTSAFSIDGEPNVTLRLYIGQTYTFNVNANGHPFYIKTARVTGSGSQFTTGVTGNGAQIGTVTFVVPATAPSQLFYQCGVHPAMGGTLTILSALDAEGTIPKVAWLGKATPNPARDGASFRFGLPQDASIDFSLFDARGRRIRNVWNGVMVAGEHSLRWDGRDDAQRVVPSGQYFYRLRFEGRQLTGRLLVTR